MVLERNNFHVKKNDIVMVISGHEKGKSGKIIRVLKKAGTVVIEKINRVKKHSKPTQKNPGGGISEIEKPLDVSKVMLFCSKCNKGVKVKHKMVKDKWIRVCKKCGQNISS